MADIILPHLTEEEEEIYRRGRNAKSKTTAKNAAVADYRKATGLEAVIGFLYLKGRNARITYLLSKGIDVLEAKRRDKYPLKGTLNTGKRNDNAKS